MPERCSETAGHPFERCLFARGHAGPHHSSGDKWWPIEEVKRRKSELLIVAELEVILEELQARIQALMPMTKKLIDAEALLDQYRESHDDELGLDEMQCECALCAKTRAFRGEPKAEA